MNDLWKWIDEELAVDVISTAAFLFGLWCVVAVIYGLLRVLITALF